MKMSRILPAVAGVLAVTAVAAAVGLTLFAGGPEESARIEGEAPEPAAVDIPTADAPVGWEDPELTPDEELLELPEEQPELTPDEEILELPEEQPELTPDEEILELPDEQQEEVITERSDPTPIEELNTPAPDPTSVPPTVLGQANFGGRGWDSSRYPAQNPIPTPGEWKLFRATDGEAHPDAQGRYWEYLTPPGSSITEACNQMLSGLAAYGMEVVLSDCGRDVAADGLTFTSIAAEGPGSRVAVNLLDEGAPCFGFDRDAICHLVSIFLRLE